MDAFVTSTLLVALAELGDRTQLLAIVLAATFQRPYAIILGIAVGALANHLLAAFVGFYLASLLDTPAFHACVAISFIVMGVWTMRQGEAKPLDGRHQGSNAFLTSLIAIFVMEMGDRTQLATAALAARFHDIVWVTLGSTAGLLLTSAPAVLLGESVTRFASLRTLRLCGGVAYVALGIAGLVRAARALG